MLWPEGAMRDQYVIAAANFRIPYWDWAAVPPAGESVLPYSVGGSPTVSVNGPNGLQVILNPLFSYQFKPLDPNQLPDPPVRIMDSPALQTPIFTVSRLLTQCLVQPISPNNEISNNAELFSGFSKWHSGSAAR
jgi:tyrosinase